MMNHPIMAKSHLKIAIYSVITTVFFGLGALPVKAELSPDAGIEVEEYQVLEQERVKQEAQAELEAKKKAEAEAKKRAAIARAAKLKAEQEAERKRQAEKLAALKLTEEQAKIVAASIASPSTLGNNISIASKDLPAGLTPQIVSEALSVKAGQNASLTIKTLPGALCNIDVFVVNRTPVVLPGLEDKTADADGLCSWKWLVKSNTPRGSWGVKVAATSEGKSDDMWTTLNVGRVQ